jgi:hypothetical protein
MNNPVILYAKTAGARAGTSQRQGKARDKLSPLKSA